MVDAIQSTSVPRPPQPRYVQIEVPIENGANNSDFSSSNYNIITNGSHSILQKIEATPTSSVVPTISSQVNSTTTKRPRPKLVRPWPVRLRHMFRMINRYRRPRCRGVNTLKQNQIRPLPGANSNDNIESTAVQNEAQATEIPSAPPPNRRKMKSPTDLQDLADTLSIIQPTGGVRVPPNHTVRRQRRKNVLRNRSPTLSPIHESGLSNPTSPQLACRHSCSGSISSSLGSSSLCGNPIANANRTT
jgi:palmitoyltransferase